MRQTVTVASGDEFLGDDDAALADGQSAPMHDASIIYKVIKDIMTSSKDWIESTESITLGAQRWLPDLVRVGKDSGVLHVHVSASMPAYIVRRLRKAAETRKVYLALAIDSLYDEDLLRFLAEIDAEVIVVGDGIGLHSAYYLSALADHSIPIRPD